MHDVTRSEKTVEEYGVISRRAIPSAKFQAIGPFILFEQIGPGKVVSHQAAGSPTHPHAGMEIMTLVLDGESLHKDNIGNISHAAPGDMHWLRAGRGVLHSETLNERRRLRDGEIHVVQLWVDLPDRFKKSPPDFLKIESNWAPEVLLGSSRVRIYSGHLNGTVGPLRSLMETVFFVADLEALQPVVLPLSGSFEYGIYILSGQIDITQSGTSATAGELIKIAPHCSQIKINARLPNTQVLIFGGSKLIQSVVTNQYFSARNKEQLLEQSEDYRNGKFGS